MPVPATSAALLYPLHSYYIVKRRLRCALLRLALPGSNMPLRVSFRFLKAQQPGSTGSSASSDIFSFGPTMLFWERAMTLGAAAASELSSDSLSSGPTMLLWQRAVTSQSPAASEPSSDSLSFGPTMMF